MTTTNNPPTRTDALSHLRGDTGWQEPPAPTPGHRPLGRDQATTILKGIADTTGRPDPASHPWQDSHRYKWRRQELVTLAVLGVLAAATTLAGVLGKVANPMVAFTATGALLVGVVLLFRLGRHRKTASELAIRCNGRTVEVIGESAVMPQKRRSVRLARVTAMRYDDYRGGRVILHGGTTGDGDAGTTELLHIPTRLLTIDWVRLLVVAISEQVDADGDVTGWVDRAPRR